jgi:hypothetical protein
MVFRMAIDQPKVIDFIGVDKITGNIVLTISDHLDWEDSPRHQMILQEKINCYLAFIESGEILETYPDAEARIPVITVMARYSPDSGGQQFLSKAKSVLHSAGILFEFEVSPGANWRLHSAR